MQKLELKHLASYLPHQLKGYTTDKQYTQSIENKTGELTQIDTIDESLVITTGSGYYICGIEEFKPILRTLTELTKEIEVNGEKFIPINKIKKEDSDFYLVEDDDYIIREKKPMGGWAGYMNTNSLPFWLTNLLFEWHFDVFGLIEKGLAIDINTLDK